MRPTVVISESTYGSQVRDSKKNTEQDLCIIAEETVRKNGNVLIPIGGVGKAQEIAALLNDHWNRYGINVPILMGTGMIDGGLTVLRGLEPSWSCINWNKLFHVKSADVNSILTRYASEPVVCLFPPKTMDSGPSLEIFKVWANDSKNLVLLPSFSVPGTIAYQILNGQRHIKLPNVSSPSSVPAVDNSIDMKASMRYFSIASHSDSIGIKSFFKYISPILTVLVHGEFNGMKTLGANLREVLRRPVCLPMNDEIIVVEFPCPRSQPAAIQMLYEKYHQQIINPSTIEAACTRRSSNSSSNRESLTTLEALLRWNFNRTTTWIAQQRKSPRKAENVQLDCNRLNYLINVWCVDLLPLLKCSISKGWENDGAIAMIRNALEQEMSWSSEDYSSRSVQYETDPKRKGKKKKQKIKRLLRLHQSIEMVNVPQERNVSYGGCRVQEEQSSNVERQSVHHDEDSSVEEVEEGELT